jgi:hypothetical protein
MLGRAGQFAKGNGGGRVNYSLCASSRARAAANPARALATYGHRPRSDTFLRDANGALVPDVIVHPPNPAILVKLLTSLAPEIYGEKSTVEHHHTGAVWIEGGGSQQAALPAPDNFNQDFGLTMPRDEVKRPTNQHACGASPVRQLG